MMERATKREPFPFMVTVNIMTMDQEKISCWMQEHTGLYNMTLSVQMDKDGRPIYSTYRYSFDDRDNAVLFKLEFGGA